MKQTISIHIQAHDTTTASSYRYEHEDCSTQLTLKDRTESSSIPNELKLTPEQLHICQQGENHAYYKLQLDHTGAFEFKLHITLDGGAFSPLHNSHEQRLFAVYDFLTDDKGRQTSKLFLLPSGQSGYSDKVSRITPHQKQAMLEYYIESLRAQGMDISLELFEISQQETSRTADTLTALTEIYKAQGITIQINFVTSDESLSKMATWKNPNKIFNQCHLLLCKRITKQESTEIVITDEKRHAIAAQLGLEELTSASQLNKDSHGLYILDVTLPPCSSTDVVELISQNNHQWHTMVPPSISDYIQQHGLYGLDRLTKSN